MESNWFAGSLNLPIAGIIDFWEYNYVETSYSYLKSIKIISIFNLL